MKLSAQEARDLMPRGYIPTEKICEKIKSIAEAGLDYLWTDLTQGQVDELRLLGYKVEKSQHSVGFKIIWDK